MNNKESGFSMVGVLIAMGIMSIILTAFAEMTLLNIKTQKNYAIRSDVEQLVETLRRVINDETSCTPALTGLSYGTSLAIRDPLVPTRVLAQTSENYVEGWRIQKLAFENVQSVSTSNGLMKGTLVLEAIKDPSISLGGRVLRRTVGDIYFQSPQNSGNSGQNQTLMSISHCYGLDPGTLVAENNCKAMGGKWFSDHKYGAQCVVTPHSNS